MADRDLLEIEGLTEPDATAVRRAIEGAKLLLGCGKIGLEVCAIGVRDSRKLNRRYRGKDKTADVLSFSLPSMGPGGMAGQVLLCPPAVNKGARRLGIPERNWLSELAIHGFLHVLGYRHDDESSRSLMFAHQRVLVRGPAER